MWSRTECDVVEVADGWKWKWKMCGREDEYWYMFPCDEKKGDLLCDRRTDCDVVEVEAKWTGPRVRVVARLNRVGHMDCANRSCMSGEIPSLTEGVGWKGWEIVTRKAMSMVDMMIELNISIVSRTCESRLRLNGISWRKSRCLNELLEYFYPAMIGETFELMDWVIFNWIE